MTPKSPGLKVEHMTARTEAEYASFVERHPRGLLYLSVQYRDFLLRILPSCEPLYLLARDAGEVVGVLPLFVHHGSKYGAVINSLPFFGSNGGILVWEGSSQAAAIRHALLEEYLRLEQSCRVAASTLITSPFESVSSDYDALLGPPADTRIGQMSALPKAEGNHDDLMQQLLARFHHKARNMVRKAQKAGISVRHSANLEDMQTLYELHRQNMVSMGGISKPWEIFAAIRDTFRYDEDYRVYVAEKDGCKMGALLVFFHRLVAEYFTPALDEEFRSLQPMSLLVFEAMMEATRRGCEEWNWGGTWRSQAGVYLFKKRWGTRDLPYFYYTRVLDERLFVLESAQLLEEYRWFYVFPFGRSLAAQS